MSVAGVAAGHNAVEQIDAAVDTLDDIAGRAYPHQVADLILGGKRLHGGDDLVHFFGRLAHCQTADGVAVQIVLGNLLHMLHAQIGKGAALIDAEQKLVGVDRLFLVLEARHLVLAAQQPACGARAAVFGVLVGGGVFDALVKRHGDGGAEVGLNLHTLLGSHKDAVTVKVGVEGHALLGDLAQLGKAEHLKPAAVGQNGTVPLGELVQPAHIRHQLVAGTQMQVVGVAQHDLRADVL